MTNSISKPGHFAIWAGPGAPKEGDYRPMSELNATAREVGVVFGPDGDNIADLVPQPESAAAIYARFNGRAAPPTASIDDSDPSDLVPKPEAATVVWDRFNGKLRAARAS